MVSENETTSGSFLIRLARYPDIEHLPAIEQRASELFRDTEFADEVSQECLSIEFLTQQFEAGRLWVAVDGDNVLVGFATALVIDSKAHLHEVSVDPSHGRRGIGRRLVEAVCDWAVSQGFDRITLSTFRDIPWNAPFYSQLGFTELPKSEWGPGIRRLCEEERESGLDTFSRVIMIRVIRYVG